MLDPSTLKMKALRHFETSGNAERQSQPRRHGLSTPLLWKAQTSHVHYCVCKGPPLILILSQMNLLRTLPSHLRSIFTSNLCLDLPSGLFRSGLSPICSTSPAHLILLNFITQIIDEEYKSWRSSLCTSFHPSYILRRPKCLPRRGILKRPYPMFYH